MSEECDVRIGVSVSEECDVRIGVSVSEEYVCHWPEWS